MENYWKKNLTSFDEALFTMVASLTQRPCEPKNGGNDKYYIVVDYSANPSPDIVNAIMDAVLGRLGDRAIRCRDFAEDQHFIVDIAFDKSRKETGIVKEGDLPPVPERGFLYCRRLKEVRAIQLLADNIGEVAEFTGAGVKCEGKAIDGRIYIRFMNNGIYAHVLEGDYIIADGGRFVVRRAKDFEAEYEQK